MTNIESAVFYLLNEAIVYAQRKREVRAGTEFRRIMHIRRIERAAFNEILPQGELQVRTFIRSDPEKHAHSLAQSPG